MKSWEMSEKQLDLAKKHSEGQGKNRSEIQYFFRLNG